MTNRFRVLIGKYAAEWRETNSKRAKKDVLQLRPSHRGKQSICYCSLKSTCRRLFSWRLQLSLYVFLDFELTALIQEEKFLSLVSGFDSDCDVDPDPSFREIMKDVEIFGNTVLSVLTLVLHTSRTAFGCTNRNGGYPAIYIHFALIFSELYDF